MEDNIFIQRFRIIAILLLVIVSCSRSDEKSSPIWINEYYQSVNLEQDDFEREGLIFEEEGLSFRRGKGEVFSDVWGRGLESKGVYPDELLPSLFHRKIILNEFDLKDAKMLWVFTGSKAGITIEISEKKVRLFQRFYDSYGFYNVGTENKNRLPHYPQKELVSAEIQYSGKLRSVSLSFDHDMELRLFLNEKLVATQMCIFDVTRHQIRYTGVEGVIAGKIVRPVAVTSTVTINNTREYQKILGFGGITSVVAYNELSEQGKKDWWNFLQEYNLLIQREYPNYTQLKEDCSNFDNLKDASVHYYGDNFPNGEISDFRYNKKIMDLGGIVIFEFWGLPSWAVTIVKDSHGRPYQRPIIDKYVLAMVNYCKVSKQKTGRPPQIVGVQNERTQSAEVWHQMTLALRKGLDENGFEDVKIHMYNSSELSRGTKAAQAFKQNEQVWKLLDFTATNMYDYQRPFMKINSYDSTINRWKQVVGDKPFLSTELCINNNKFQHDSYHLAFAMGMLYHKNLVMMDASAIMYCWLLLNGPQSNFDATRSLFTVSLKKNSRPVPSSHQLRVFGAFSRHLPKGMKRVSVENKNKNKNVFISAFQNKNQKTVIIMNCSSQIQKVEVHWPGSSFTCCEITDSFKRNVKVPVSSIVDDNHFVLKGGQIITLFN